MVVPTVCLTVLLAAAVEVLVILVTAPAALCAASLEVKLSNYNLPNRL